MPRNSCSKKRITLGKLTCLPALGFSISADF